MVTSILKSLESQRKYTLAWFFALSGTILTWFDKLSIVYVEFTAIILGIYGVANVGARYVDNRFKSPEQ